MLLVGKSLMRFNSEMLFEYPHVVKGGTYLNWAHGTVKKAMNKSIHKVLIEWNNECSGRLDNKNSATLVHHKVKPKAKHKGGSLNRVLEGVLYRIIATVHILDYY